MEGKSSELLTETHIENLTSFLDGLLSLEYLQLRDCVQIRDWCLGDVTFHKLKLLKLAFLSISSWNVSEESFPLLEILVINGCHNLEEIPLALQIFQVEGCDRIVITTQVSRNKLNS